MFNVFNVADTLVNHIITKFPNDIAIITYQGSYARGTATKRSDFDFFFIPTSSTGYRHSLQFIVNNISFDFFPVSWERAERMATFEELSVASIADSKILYARSDEDRDRFFKLREKISEVTKQEMEMLKKSELQLREAYIHLYNMSRFSNSEDITLYRHEAQEILMNVLYSVSLINRTYFSKGWGKNTEQIKSFSLKPNNLEQLMETIMRSVSCVEIRESCELLTQNTLDLLLQQRELHSKGPSYPDRMRGFYEEVKGIFDKILTACENKDYTTAYFFSIGVQREVSQFLYYAEKGYWPVSLDTSLDYRNVYKQLGFPDLTSILDAQNLLLLFEAIKSLDSLLENYLKNQGVEINRFSNIEEFNNFLKEKDS